MHCGKSVRIRSFSGPYFPAFGLNTERSEVSLCIQSECGKIRARETPNIGTFQVVNRGKTWKGSLYHRCLRGPSSTGAFL